ncbi:hypothetical protein SAMN04488066_104146 [Halorubrum aquaticum]|uniref:Uncharacterized protein n=1 Tax=Halorubrum aquaticum TaxID=387340 RepID=A0A1I3A4P1_9EURY|nr:hypothetical protein [Halorubrum aquaticum]SFH45044.1 hypothetical protein SAMN04488066_104146 [Halorubrum aquaticum]
MKHITTGSHPAAPWAAVEFVTTSKSPAGYHGTPISRLLARVIYRALFDEHLNTVTLLAVSGHHRERYLLRSRPTTHSTESTERLASIANDELPLDVGISIVEVDPAPLGNTPVPVHRLLTTRDHPVERARTSTPTPVEQLLEIAAGIRPHAIQLVVGRFESECVEVSLRIADFSPEVATHTAAGDAHYHQDAPDMTAPFDAFNLTTNRELIFDHGWELHTEPRVSGPPAPMVTHEHGATTKISTIASARTLSRTPTEYAALFSDHPPAAPLTSTYAQHGVLPWIRLDTELLPAFCGLREQTYHVSPWDTFGRAPPRITPQYTLRKPTPPAASPPPSAPIPTAAELEIESSFGRTALEWAREQGGNITDDHSSPFEEFTAVYPDRTHRCVIVTDPQFVRGDLIAVAADVHQSSTTDRLTVFTDATEVAARARHCLQQPFEITAAGTRLYERSTPLREDIATAVRERTANTEWTLTPDGVVVYHHKGNAVLSRSRDGSFSTLVSDFPRAYQQDDEILVRTAAGDNQLSYATRDAFFEACAFVRRPAVPTWLAAGLEFVTVLTQEASALREYQQQASWDCPQLPTRDQAAAADFFAIYTVSDSEKSLAVSAVEAEFVAWLRHQSEEPISGSFAHNLKSQFPGSLSDLHVDELPGRTWRYPFETSGG